MSKMRKFVNGFGALAIAGLSGCSMVRRGLPSINASQCSLTCERPGLEFGIEPLDTSREIRKFVGRVDEGVLPLYLAVKNNSSFPVTVYASESLAVSPSSEVGRPGSVSNGSDFFGNYVIVNPGEKREGLLFYEGLGSQKDYMMTFIRLPYSEGNSSEKNIAQFVVGVPWANPAFD